MRWIAGFLIIPLCVSCTVARMDVSGLQNKGLGGLGGGTGGSGKALEQFTAGPGLKQVDILVVDDNSASMDPRQTSLGTKFSSFASALAGVDWQLGITTTDCSTDQWGICGSLLQLTGYTDYLLTPNVANFASLFQLSVVRPETVGCVSRGNCPSGISEPLKATMTAFDKRSTNNARFFRPGATLAVIMLTNADERDDGITGNPTQPQAVIDHFHSIWGTSKEFRVYAIDIMPGDTACYNSDVATSVGLTYYGTLPSALATATGGFSMSLCEPDYSTILSQIGGDLQSSPTVVVLKHTPTGTVNMSFSPSPATQVTTSLVGNVMTFTPALPPGTAITITYDY